MNIATMALLGLISGAEAQQLMTPSTQEIQEQMSSASDINWSAQTIDCMFGINRMSMLQNSTDFADHPKGVMYKDPSFPASATSLYWKDFQPEEISSFSKVDAWKRPTELEGSTPPSLWGSKGINPGGIN